MREADFQNATFIAQSQENVDFIISLANVSNRGKNMILRDLSKMEDVEI